MDAERLRQDLIAIERLHRADSEAVESGDLERLPALVSEAAVMMPPGAGFQRGRGPTPEAIASWKEAYRDYLDVRYEFRFEEVVPLGDFAFEWGTVHSRVRKRDGSEEREAHKILRILRREADGEWRVYRAMWNELPAAPGAAGEPTSASGQERS